MNKRPRVLAHCAKNVVYAIVYIFAYISRIPSIYQGSVYFEYPPGIF